ncbi:UDP-N-acetyl glucosamine 2-epimerase [Pullulanibacillus camelliae]|uniref:UDP-N-acetylglucosamine 2-epimerase (non-hydrolyzing) n=1 Tax=Pullulanibacillus camelliae TaxID=1707096 RepID=A0A8J2YN88_9BACL|nr:UDP-N-acetylglucosamine 2-epimerase (non-hydrolyzing) [Pullulanibacillus camelliae]GGE54707.1 UDP-N-acetyl glucosamine 2-epimerase [Pullulanibacillus camelliae]
MGKIKVMTIFGTRPEAVKMAPLVLELNKHPEQIESIVTVTAQHREMLDQVLAVFNIKPDFDLHIMKERQTLSDITVKALSGLDQVLKEVKPDLVLVHGDTTTSFVGGLAAFYNQIPVGHVEAGLRTYNKYSPYPEEMNRQLTGVLADLHFAPTDLAAEHLLKENKSQDSIFVTGNTVIDALTTTVRENYSHPVLEEIGDRKMLLITAHRRENLGEKMRGMFRAIRRIVDEQEDLYAVYPVHLNPAVRELAQAELNHPRIQLIEPLGVIDFHNFQAKAHLIMTDSGGVQEEAPTFGVPVLVLRDTTERPEGVQAGTLKLVGTKEDDVYESAKELLTDTNKYETMAKAANPFGDGRASERIVSIIMNRYH